jgi:nucleotidyltransferase/DNA polymerase involved in DNA repair
VVNERRGRRFLAPLPLTALPADDEFRRRLALLGVHTLGELSSMPRNALIRQFGARAGFLHDLASGADPRPLQPDAPPLELHHEMAFEPPTVDRRTLAAAADRMATAMAAKLERQGYQTQGLRIELTDTVQKLHTTTTSIEPPTAAGDRLSRRCQALVNRLKVQRPAEHLKIIIYPLRPTYLGMTQLTLFSATLDQRWQALQEALRRLKARFGEFIVMVASLISPPQPRPITIIAGPDNAPRTLIWETEGRARRTHRVRHIYEHWRVRRRWWGQPIRRDYYRLEDDAGAVRLVYRDLNTDAWWLERRRL